MIEMKLVVTGGASLITLFDKAREKSPVVMVTIDADGQHIPEFIP